jgi:plastocyanin
MNKNILIGIIVVAIIVLGIVYLKTSDSDRVITAPFITTSPGVTTSATPTPSPTPSATPVVSGTVKEFVVEGKNFAFVPPSITVKKGDTVKITFKNTGGFHDWKIDEFHAATKRINGGEQDTVTFVADKAGTFEYYCSVGTHRQMGMKGNLIVE